MNVGLLSKGEEKEQNTQTREKKNAGRKQTINETTLSETKLRHGDDERAMLH